LIGRLLAGDPAALARVLTVLESGGSSADSMGASLRPHIGRARVIGFTGPPGAGKSTLISVYIAALRRREQRVAVLAIDPSSPISGGALLGDRTRMTSHATDHHVFIRSIASAGHRGGLAPSIPAMLNAIDAAGWPTIILETVGTGQTEVAVAELADVNVVLTAPGLGDDIQALKAGILETADVLVVNKSDRPDADQVRQQLKRAIALRSVHGSSPRIVATSATTGAGIEELVHAIASKAEAVPIESRTAHRLQVEILHLVRSAFEASLEQLDLDDTCARVGKGELTPHEAAEALLGIVSGN
jgi:LAO/AO transport system kinase